MIDFSSLLIFIIVVSKVISYVHNTLKIFAMLISIYVRSVGKREKHNNFRDTTI